MTDAARFEAFVREYQDMVFATAMRLLANPAEAEDVSQTVFLRAFQRFGDIGTSETVAGWLKTVTRNLCLNHLARYRARWQFFSEMTAPGAAPYESRLVASAGMAVDAAEGRRQERLARALAALPDRQRVPLVLFHFEELSYQDIAAALCVSLSKVKTDIHRGREALRRVLA